MAVARYQWLERLQEGPSRQVQRNDPMRIGYQHQSAALLNRGPDSPNRGAHNAAFIQPRQPEPLDLVADGDELRVLRAE